MAIEHNQNSGSIEVLVVDTAEAKANCLAIRFEVFVDEQHVPVEEEVDAFDDSAIHFLAVTAEQEDPVGTARMLTRADGKVKVGRVAVLQKFRRRGVGTAIMSAVERYARTHGTSKLVLDAQLQAIPFYEAIGYNAFGPVFLDAGIEHRSMEKVLTNADYQSVSEQ